MTVSLGIERSSVPQHVLSRSNVKALVHEGGLVCKIGVRREDLLSGVHASSLRVFALLLRRHVRHEALRVHRLQLLVQGDCQWRRGLHRRHERLVLESVD